MSEQSKIRKYQPVDLEQCRDLWRELVEWHREIYQDLTIGGEHPEEYFDKYLAEAKPDHIWVADHDSQVIGLAGLIIRGGEAELEPLIVSKSHRRKGIGEQLVKTVVNEVRNRGIHHLNVKPVARNIQAIAFLYKRGFTKLGSIELFIDFSDYAWKQGPELFGCKFDY